VAVGQVELKFQGQIGHSVEDRRKGEASVVSCWCALSEIAVTEEVEI
jgi:hypothetical protein